MEIPSPQLIFAKMSNANGGKLEDQTVVARLSLSGGWRKSKTESFVEVARVLDLPAELFPPDGSRYASLAAQLMVLAGLRQLLGGLLPQVGAYSENQVGAYSENIVGKNDAGPVRTAGQVVAFRLMRVYGELLAAENFVEERVSVLRKMAASEPSGMATALDDFEADLVLLARHQAAQVSEFIGESFAEYWWHVGLVDELRIVFRRAA